MSVDPHALHSNENQFILVIGYNMLYYQELHVGYL